MADPNGTRATATNLGSIAATGTSHSNSVGGYITTLPPVFDQEDFFSFNAPDKADYRLTFSTPNTSFGGYVGAEITTGDARSLVVGKTYIESFARSKSFEFTNYFANTKYGLETYRYILANSTPDSGKTKVDYTFTIKPINFFPDSLLVYDLKSSYRQNESISLNQLYVNDRDGWGDVNNLKMQIVDSNFDIVKNVSSSSFTKWDGGATWAKTNLNLSLDGLAPGNYTARFSASDSKLGFSDNVNRQFTIAAADPLTGMTDSVYRFYNESSGFHFYTSNTSERDSLIGNPNIGYQYEGPAFKVANSKSDSSQLPLFRFYDTAIGDHFYTTSVSERDSIISNLHQYQYEGTAFNVLGASANVGTDVHRFYNTQTGAHFYTASAAERDSVIASLPAFTYEGVAFEVAI